MRAMKILRFLLPLVFLPAQVVRADAQALAGFERVVVAEDALPVQKAAADELAGYVSAITGRELEIVSVKDHIVSSRLVPTFFVGDKAAALAKQKLQAAQDVSVNH